MQRSTLIFATNATLTRSFETQSGYFNNIKGPSIALFFKHQKSISLSASAEDLITSRDADTDERKL
jgi:hypothetical protein